MVYVFVYGTLKRGYGNHVVLGESEFIGEATTVEDTFSMFNGGFPWVSDSIDEGSTGRVVGELYEVTSKKIEQGLDRLEGVPHMYVRRYTDVTTMDGVTFPAIMYIASDRSDSYLKENGRVIEPVGRARLLEWNK